MSIDLELIRFLYESGMSSEEVGNLFDLHRRSVLRYIRRVGGTVRRRGNPGKKAQ